MPGRATRCGSVREILALGITCAALVALVAPRIAHAEPEAAKPSDKAGPDAGPVLPPRPVPRPSAVYPEGETAAASVVVELVVEEDGSPSALRVARGNEPFASAALAAVQRYRFEPARRAGHIVRARIRLLVEFTPPEAEAGEPVTEVPEASPSGPKSAPEIEEVQVLGSRRPVGSPTEHRMGRAEIRMVPGAFGDPYRAIDILPGVVPIVSGLPYFFVRGAPPSAVGYFVDEVRVPYLFHFGLGPGVVQPALVEEVSLHPAAFPARYGRFAGGVVAGQLREPATELRGEAQVRVFDAGAYVEAPFANGRATAGVGGRYSYTAALLSLVAPDVSIDYRDYNARASYALADNVRVSAFALGAFDFASNTERGREEVLFASEFHRLDLRLDRQTSTSQSRVALMVGLDRTRLQDARFAQNRLVGLRARHRVRVHKELDVEVGADALAELYGGDLPSPYAVSTSAYREALNFFSPRTDTASGAWLSTTWLPTKGFELTGTLRGDVFTSEREVAFGPSPRVSMRVPLGRGIAFLGALGIAPQPPAFAIPVPAIGFRGLPGGLAFAYQKSAGVELELPARFNLRTVGFHHSYLNLRDFSRDRSNLDVTDATLPSGSPAQGYGLEVFLNRKLSERFGAFVSYTLSRSELGATATDPARVAPFDRTHVLQLGGVADLGAGWHTSARLLTYTGWPREADDVAEAAGVVAPASGRLPAFTRVDLRIEKRWRWRKAGYISFVIEGLNVTGTRDVVGRSCDASRGCRDQYFGPVVAPSIGVEGAL